jgi:NADPH:quinone reductase-like Zn-dependent oxidoreductase
MSATDAIARDARSDLICTQWADPPRLEVRRAEVPFPGPRQVLVRVVATSVNPIDVQRAAGHGRRLLGLLGAASLPLVLGNDVAGVVEHVGRDVSSFAPGERVVGVVGTDREGGAHASYALVPEQQLVRVPDRMPFEALAVLPRTFTTMWRAVASTGLEATNAHGKRVLVDGADGGLGRLAIQLLRGWGSRVTAICAPDTRDDCLALGAEVAVERAPGLLDELPTDFDVVLNFGDWHDESPLAARLKSGALGYATTVHPLLANCDRFGCVRGAFASWRDWRRMRERVRAFAPHARYTWTVFRPDRSALAALAALVRMRALSLPVGIAVPLQQAAAAFAHVAAGKRGRAVLLPA